MVQGGRTGNGRVQAFLITRPVKIEDVPKRRHIGESPKRKNTIVQSKNKKNN